MASRFAAELRLDQIDDYFKIGKKIDIATTPRSRLGGHLLDPTTGGPALPDVKPFIPPYKRHTRVNNPMQTEYARDYQEAETEDLVKEARNAVVKSLLSGRSETTSVTGHMDRVDLDSTITGLSSIRMPEGMTEEDLLKVYKHYNFEHKYDQNLAITKHREEIVRLIEANQVTVIEGETGSGKTTQVAQYILDDYARQGRYCNIVVTQPRRIAAKSICKRVCHERDWVPGGVCGYQIGQDKEMSEDTRLLFCTTGILLQKLIGSKHLREFTHVILDEVHDRDQDSDFAILVVRKFLRSNSSGVKVVLMSATIQTSLFANYFSVPVGDKLYPSPVMKIEGRTYTVKEFYLEDLAKLQKNLPEQTVAVPHIPETLYALCCDLIEQLDPLEIPLYGSCAERFSQNRGSVLVFLPGINEITDLYERLKPTENDNRLQLITLHSSLPGEDQIRVFHKPPPGTRKIILSTNIAESSITVPDIRYVIDFCLTKHMVCDPETNYSSLQMQWAAKANCKQRKGRAGRVSNGRVYRLVTRRFYEDAFPEYSTPEMQRCPLENLVLNTKRLDIGEPKKILGLALSPPNLDDLEKTVLMLKEIGALSTLSEGEPDAHDGDLTFMGHVLANLQVDIRLGKLLLLGHVFGVLDDAIIIAACISLRSFFSKPFKGVLSSFKSKLAWASDSNSDCIAALNAYKVWAAKVDNHEFADYRAQIVWGRDNFVEIRRIHEVRVQVDEITRRLRSFNILTPPRPANRHTTNQQNQQLILKLVMCGAFYPHYFVQEEIDELEARKFVGGRNPFTTVMVKGVPSGQGAFYRDQMEKLFADCDPSGARPKVTFEETRAYVEFVKDFTAQKVTQIPISVYLALKLRNLGSVMRLRQLSDAEIAAASSTKCQQPGNLSAAYEKASAVAGASGDIVAEEAPDYTPRQVQIPPDAQWLEVYVSEIRDCSFFWVHPSDPDSWEKLNILQQKLNTNTHLFQLLPPESVREGVFCLAPFEDTTREYYRAKVVATPFIKHREKQAKVFYLDYGNVATLNASDLREIQKEHFEFPFMALQCCLAGLRPSPIKCAGDVWSHEATQKFSHLTLYKTTLRAQIFSVVDGVLRVDLYDLQGDRSLHINKYLFEEMYAEKCDETIQSRLNHDAREDARYGVGVASLTLSPREEAEAKRRAAAAAAGDAPAVTAAKNARTLRDVVYEKTAPTNHPATRNPASKMINLQGPFNPYEIEFHSMNYVGRLRRIRIDCESVNSVAIEHEPQLRQSSLMVAAYVGLSPSGSVMQARNTTILPKIPGLPALLALLFAPTAELRVDKKRQRYTGALCGLGYDVENEGPMLPDHDMEIAFTTAFDATDLGMINSIRLAINVALNSEDTVADCGPELMIRIQTQACERILQLVRRRRASVEPVASRRAWQWGTIAPQDILYPELEIRNEGSALYLLHQGIALAPAAADTQNAFPDDKDLEEDYDNVSVQLNPRARLQQQQQHPFQQQQQQPPLGQPAYRPPSPLYPPSVGAWRHSQLQQQHQPRTPPAALGVSPRLSVRPKAGRLCDQYSHAQKAAARRHIARLREQASMSTEREVTKCLLCSCVVSSPKELSMHLSSQSHKMREDIINDKM